MTKEKLPCESCLRMQKETPHKLNDFAHWGCLRAMKKDVLFIGKNMKNLVDDEI